MISVHIDGKAKLTPGKEPLAVPTQALADAIVQEWKANKKFSPTAMPLTSMAYTAIDQVRGQKENMIEVLLAYVDTDALCYRAGASEKLGVLQKEQWDPLLVWAGKQFGAIWQTTSGVMPITQPEALNEALRKHLQSFDEMQLVACAVLASLYSSLVLALAVIAKYTDADRAFNLSRLEEEAQAEAWGRDEAAEARAERSRGEVEAAGRFLRLLENP